VNEIPQAPIPRATPVHTANIAVSQAVAETPDALITGQSGTAEDVLIYQLNAVAPASEVARRLGATRYHSMGPDPAPVLMWEAMVGDRPVVLVARNGDEDHLLAHLLDDSEPVVVTDDDLFARIDDALADHEASLIPQ
jgi:hypothetical protein